MQSTVKMYKESIWIPSRSKLGDTNIVKDSLIMVVAGGGANLCAYVYQLVMGVMITAAEYATLLSLISIFVIISVLTQAVTISAAKTTAELQARKETGSIKYFWLRAFKVSMIGGTVLFLVLSGLSPIISDFLQVNNYTYIIVVFSSFIIQIAIAVNWGVMQGLQKFVGLASNQLILGVLKVGIAVMLVALGFNILGGVIAIPASMLAAWLLTFKSLRPLISTKEKGTCKVSFFSSFSLTTLAILAIMICTNIDVILAKHYLEPVTAGNYSVLSILGRIVFYAPGGIAVAMLPKTSGSKFTDGGARSFFVKSFWMNIAIVCALCLAYAFFAEPIMRLTFSDKYPQVAGYLFKYGVGMAFFSLVYLFIIYLLSTNRTNGTYALVGVTILQVILIVLFHRDIPQFVNIMFFSGLLSLIAVAPFLFIRKNPKVSRGGLLN